MLPNAKLLVSFVVPTLNRMPHVLRAVRSCLVVEQHGVDVQVVVSDSGSSDGSWEALNKEFGSDGRVVFTRSRSGCGPTENWLNGARHVTGDYVTFVWSDDFIAPHFLKLLLPKLQRGASLAVGCGAVRDVDDDSDLPSDARTEECTREEYLGSYLGIGHRGYPVSPTCSLFSRQGFDAWTKEVELWTRANPLRNEIMWRRGIGPDLLLYLVTAAYGGDSVPTTSGVTAQFSMHPGSITCGSHRLPLETGYWLATLWLVHRRRFSEHTKDEFVRLSARAFLRGMAIAGRSWSLAPDKVPSLLRELGGLLRLVSQRRTRAAFAFSVLVLALATVHKERS